jgi:hypothetical protein
MRGFVIPTLTIMFVVGTIGSVSVIAISVNAITGLFESTSQSSDAQWVQSNVAELISEKCRQSGIQDPSPSSLNFTKTFDGIDKIYAVDRIISSGTIAATHKGAIALEYQNANQTALISKSTFKCAEFKLNGTSPNGNSLGRSKSINLDDTQLKFRVFESSHSGTSPDKNITLQVRQD